MRLIGTVPSEVSASQFSDYLLTQKIDAHIEESSSGQWQVWIEHDDDLERATAELAAFMQSPGDRKYGSSSASAAKIRKLEQQAAERRRKNFRDVRTSTAFSGITQRATPIAIMMIAACVLLFAIGRVNPAGNDRLFELMIFDNTPATVVDLTPDGAPVFGNTRGTMFDDILHGQVWRLVTPVLLHGGFLHILFNMMWLWRLGQLIEGIKGSLFFGILVLTIAILSCSAEAGWYEVNGTWGSFIGMSGVNAGLLGYAWMKRKYQPYERIAVTDSEIGMMIGWLVICSLGVVGGIANAAHWGGLAIGMLIGAFPYWYSKIRSRG